MSKPDDADNALPAFAQRAESYHDLAMMVAPGPADVDVVVWWPQPAEMLELTRAYEHAAATRLLHAVYLAEAAPGT